MITSNIQEFCTLLTKPSYILSLDFGDKKIGIAVSNMDHTMSLPVKVIENNISNISEIVKQYNPCAIVIGLPVNMDGTRENLGINKIYNFANKIYEIFSIPIFLQDERLTSKTADNLLKNLGLSRKNRNEIDDKIAAAMILDSALNSIAKVKITNLPEGFVYIKDLDQTILQDIRYGSENNFIGRKIDGYIAKEAVLTNAAAERICYLQQELLKSDLSLLIYDAYRPVTAVEHFVNWTKNHDDQKMKDLYYPRIEKSTICESGYISPRSRHSSGSTIDLTIVDLNANYSQKVTEEKRTLKDGFEFIFLDDGSIDMGAHFDLFDIASHHDSTIVTDLQLKWRNFLREKMQSHGFRSYRKEWWHYELENEPFEGKYFDFQIL